MHGRSDPRGAGASGGVLVGAARPCSPRVPTGDLVTRTYTYTSTWPLLIVAIAAFESGMPITGLAAFLGAFGTVGLWSRTTKEGS